MIFHFFKKSLLTIFLIFCMSQTAIGKSAEVEAFQRFKSSCADSEPQFYQALVKLDKDLYKTYSKKSQMDLQNKLYSENESDDVVRYFVPYLITDKKISRPYLGCWARFNNAIVSAMAENYKEADLAMKDWGVCQSSAFQGAIPDLPKTVLDCYAKVGQK